MSDLITLRRFAMLMSNNYITSAGYSLNNLLLEDGSGLLLELGGAILLEQ